MIFSSIVSPLLEEIATVFVQGLQILNAKFKLKISEYNIEITKNVNAADELDTKSSSYAIGFQVETEESDEED